MMSEAGDAYLISKSETSGAMTPARARARARRSRSSLAVVVLASLVSLVLSSLVLLSFPATLLLLLLLPLAIEGSTPTRRRERSTREGSTTRSRMAAL